MKKVGWIALIAVAFSLAGCPKYKPYLDEQYRGPADEPDSSIPGVLTGKRGEYVIYGK